MFELLRQELLKMKAGAECECLMLPVVVTTADTYYYCC